MVTTVKRSNFNLFFKTRKFLIAKAIALAIFPCVLLLLPSDFFDKGPDVCLFTLLSGYHCWGCGMTRGCMHLIHLDFQKAWDYNSRCFIALPVLCGLLLTEFIRTIKQIIKLKKAQDSLV
jgi:Protein of unknown function (DUF2752)